LTQVLDDKNQKSIAGILENMDNLSRRFVANGPEISATIAQTRVTLKKAGEAADQFSQLAGTANAMLDGEGKPMIADLRATLGSAKKSLDSLDKTMAEARPGVQTFSRQTLPEIGLLVQDLRETSRSIRAISERLDQQGVGSLIGSPSLPDYKK
jgi:phospholipid/cholesterol/gamma-HCH transport system substrate-binding protein